MSAALPEDVQAHLSHELSENIPQNEMGRSTFSWGSLVKTICRQDTGVVDIDAVSCWINLRRRRALLHYPGRSWPAWDQFKQMKPLFHMWVSSFAHGVTLQSSKVLLISLAAGGSIDGWAKEEGATIDSSRLTEAWESEVGCWISSFVKEMVEFAQLEARRLPEVAEEFEGEFNPHFKVVRRADEHDEVVDVAWKMRRGEGMFYSGEWDGAAIWGDPSTEVLARMQGRVGTTIPLDVKPLRDPVELAMEKYPELDWQELDCQTPTSSPGSPGLSG
eukprot:gnl/TRDRNA2_/TRDRNA2_177603_c4_seq1.p1 gnl/TRDRNA2_/TRDRNA2_177603_c4~~gnl/TRDRNA2_/TRDRNA2_177603_c4_seq1.p1  ORF type:complete len:299 (-),score=38.72 gnl/TRDRNA2_/TRDRNA2_177603_c4_seq1:107-931(-)